MTNINVVDTLPYKCIGARDLCGSDDFVVLTGALIDCRNWLILHRDNVIVPESVTSLSCLVGRGNNSAAELKTGEYAQVSYFANLPTIHIDRGFFVGGDYNYYHYSIDFASAFYMKSRLPPRVRSLPAICAGKHSWQRQLINFYADPDQNIFEVRSPVIIEVDELYFSKRCFRLDGRTEIMDYHNWIRKRTDDLQFKGGHNRIYLSRAKARNRRVRNEDGLTSRLADFGYTLVFAEDMSVAEQIAVFRDAEVIVSPHGAGLTNIIYSKPKSTVIELMPSETLQPQFFKNICNANGVIFSRLECSGKFTDENFPVDFDALRYRFQELGLV